ncbi:MAG: hypothetical protein GOMPHAMPRED_004228 [Gomphillus americanus]|uniref:Peptidase S54 rhomboid domain-containing protein n=1 Tax=Gomphillus americanus TaxID=1940652 RepID=A0A8H3FIY0_9LECA|nr:MAG: hypothetical protein GOMPHAMPRED_004228 [Gomphillus americanus]
MLTRVIFRSRSWIPCRGQRRSFTGYQYQAEPEIPRVKYIRPVIWSAAAIGLIYFQAAQTEITLDYKHNGIDSKRGTSLTFEQIEAERVDQARAEMRRRSNANVSLYDLTSNQALATAWNSLTSVERAAGTVTGLNGMLHLSRIFFPDIRVAHLPIQNTNWTLLTSMFGHGGSFHLIANMYVLNSFALPVGASKTFKGSTSHCVAFYLSSGILSCLAYHLQSAVKPMYRYIPCLGSSGAIYAMIGAFGMSHPDAGIGIIFLPFSVPAQQALYGLAAFELYGTIFGWGLGLAHISHLTGLAVGVSYVYYNGGIHVWRNLKKFIYEVESGQRREIRR